jgi:diguanylate cyclase (GGDEF)-like protein
MSAASEARPTLAAIPSGAKTADAAEVARLDLLLRDLAQVLCAELALVVGLEGNTGEVVSSWGVDGAITVTIPKRRVMRLRTDHPPQRGSFVGRALAHGCPAFEALHPELDANLINGAGASLTHALAVPVPVLGGDAHLVLVAAFSTPPEDFARTLWVADAYARLVAVIACHPDALSGLTEYSRCDALTGCLSYESVLHELTREINRSARAPLPLSCCFIDLDEFKGVNDHYGHLHGNEVLARVGLSLREGVRSCDTVGRYGGDEFVAILPQTGETEAAVLADRLRSLVASGTAEPLSERLTASIGVAEWAPGISSEQLLARADQALFAAKALPGGVSTYGRATTPLVG